MPTYKYDKRIAPPTPDTEAPSQPMLRWEDAPEGATMIIRSNNTGICYWGRENADCKSTYLIYTDEGDFCPINKEFWTEHSRRVKVNRAEQYKPSPYEPTLLEAHSAGWGFKPGQQFKGYVVAYHADWLWFAVDGVPEPAATRLDKVTFTKPLTPEEQERAKAVKELADLIAHHIRHNPIDEEDIANDLSTTANPAR